MDFEKLIEPARLETISLVEKTIKNLPYIISALVILILSLCFAFWMARWIRGLLTKRTSNVLVAGAVSKAVLAVGILLGLFLTLKTSGLSGLAVTLMGGTGLVGIGLGFALKGTFENYIAGLVISFKDIFRKGELVVIEPYEGIIQSVTTRGTTLMDYDGNSIIIPNAQVVSSAIKNLTRNPKMRLHFNVGIGYDDNFEKVKSLIEEFFINHADKILSDPPPFVSLDSLGSATVNIRVNFWINTTKVSQFKVKSWAINSIKVLLLENNISMPDDAREIVFASPLQISEASSAQKKEETAKPSQNDKVFPQNHPQIAGHESEEFLPEIEELREQALTTEPPEKGQSLI